MTPSSFPYLFSFLSSFSFHINIHSFQLTIRFATLRRRPFTHFPFLLQIDIPALGVAGLILQREAEDCVDLLDSIGAVCGGGVQRGGYSIESGRGGK